MLTFSAFFSDCQILNEYEKFTVTESPVNVLVTLIFMLDVTYKYLSVCR